MSSSTMSMTSASTSGTVTTASSTDPPTTGSDTTASDDTMTPGDCGAGEACLGVPNGWMGPFRPEAGLDLQCDDASLAALFAGTATGLAGECTCDCGSATHTACIGEWYIGGAAGSCGDNDELLGTCTIVPGDVDCDVGSDGCYVIDEATSYETYSECTDGVGGTVEPAFTSGYRLCDPDDAVGSPCDGGVCTDGTMALCIAALTDADACPDDFPERVDAHQNLPEGTLDCPCECRDEDDCTYQTWYESDCGAGPGDDDPGCSPESGGVRFLDDFPDTTENCTASPDLSDPEVVPEDAITLCCNIAI